jgi:hypothetical protein
MDKDNKIQELRKIVAGSSRFRAFLELLAYLADDVTDIDKPLKPVDSLEIRQAIRKYLQVELDILRRIPQTRNDKVEVHRDDT